MKSEDMLRQTAAAQYGYFSTKQAANAGFESELLAYHVRSGHWRKIDWSVYRFPGYEDSVESDFARWTLWASKRAGGRRVVISHDSAFYYYGFTGQQPEAVHLILPSRRNKGEKPGCVFHFQTLDEPDVAVHPGFCITTPYRTLLDMKPDLILKRKWVEEVTRAESKGMLDAAMVTELLGGLHLSASGRTGAWGAKGEGMAAQPRNLAAGTGARTADVFAQAGSVMYRRVSRKGIWGGRSAFTLVELLVVITIICILAALLMPTLRRAADAARQTGCLNNLKNIGIGALSYVDSFHGFLPARGGTNGPQWIVAVEPFIGSSTKWPGTGSRPRGVWACPASMQLVGWWQSDYGTNPATGTSPTDPGTDYALNRWIKAQRVKHPTKTFLCVDSGSHGGGNNTECNVMGYVGYAYAPGGAGPRHNGRIGMLYVDGHVASVDAYNHDAFPNGYTATLRGVGVWVPGQLHPWSITK